MTSTETPVKKKKTMLPLEERVKKAEIAYKKLKEQLKNKKVSISKDSTGMSELLTLIDKVASDNKVKVGDVILFVSKNKRTGLKLVPKSNKTTKSN